MPRPTSHWNRLAGKVAIVTGAGSEGSGVGNGKAIALLFAAEGARVCLVDRDRERAEDTPAMTQLAREIAVMHGRDGIRANTVAPGHIFTPLAMSLLGEQARAQRRDVSPLGIEGDAWDVAHATLFLASEEARFLTGVLLPVDGGVTEIGPLAAHALLARSQSEP